MASSHKLAAFLMALLLLSGTFDQAESGPLVYGICQAGCFAAVCLCFTAAGVTFGTVPGAVIAATPALAACNAALSTCSAACAAMAITPTP